MTDNDLIEKIENTSYSFIRQKDPLELEFGAIRLSSDL